MAIVVTAGQRGDSPQFEPVLEKVRAPRIPPPLRQDTPAPWWPDSLIRGGWSNLGTP